MEYLGVLEADFQGAREYRRGGIGPFFGETRLEGPFRARELLARLLHVFQKLGAPRVDALYVDEEPLYEDPEGDEPNLDEIIELVDYELQDEDASSVYLTLTYDEADLEHTIAVEASIDHPAEEPALRVLDTALALEPEDEGEEDWREEDAEVGPAQAEVDAVTAADNETRSLRRVRAFLERLQAELGRELALEAPEVSVWTNEGGGVYAPEQAYREAPEAGPPLWA